MGPSRFCLDYGLVDIRVQRVGLGVLEGICAADIVARHLDEPQVGRYVNGFLASRRLAVELNELREGDAIQPYAYKLFPACFSRMC